MEKIAIDEIVISNPYLRINTDIDSLKKSIQTVGLINPLTINNDNELLAGGRRYSALKELGEKEVLVKRIDLTTLEQELVSIDENLVRSPLNKLELEQCLNRGREIYEEINPTANKIDTEVKKLTPAEKKQEKEDEESDTTSFAAITSEKTGLSKSVIKNAIKRDARSSQIIKQARSEGELSASQVNEIIKLDEKDQETILPYVKEKSVKEVRKIVERAREAGLNAAIADSIETKELPRELTQLEAIVKRCNKQMAKVLIENIHVEGDQLKTLISQVEKIQKQSSDFLEFYSDGTGDYFPHKSNSSDMERPSSYS